MHPAKYIFWNCTDASIALQTHLEWGLHQVDVQAEPKVFGKLASRASGLFGQIGCIDQYHAITLKKGGCPGPSNRPNRDFWFLKKQLAGYLQPNIVWAHTNPAVAL
jgi:hypothetical protein